MQALDSGGGIIGAPTAADPFANAASAASQAAQHIAQSGPFLNVSLPQLPADMPPVQAPDFTLSRREFDDDHGSALGGAHMPGMGGGDATHAASFGDPSGGLLGQANDALNHAQSQFGTVPGAQSAFDGAHAALNSAPAAMSNAAASFQQAPATISSALTSGDPIATLAQHGIAVPAFPGIEQLFQPIASLLQSFGSGVMGALNPSTILSESSQVIQAAMQVGEGAMKSVSQVWQGKSSDSAQTASDQAQTKGQDTSQRGIDISKLTTDAAAVVQKGNVQLTAVAQSLAAQATAMLPTLPTPPGQAALIATATEHLGTAVGIVNATRGELSGYTGQLTGVVNQLLGQSGMGQQAAQAAQSVAQNVAQPIMEQAQSLLSNNGNSDSSSTAGSATDPSTAMTAAGYNGAHPGSGMFGGGGGGGGLGGGDSFGGTGSTTGGGAGTSVPGTAGINPAAAAASLGAATRPAGMSSPGFMGGGAGAANARNASEEEHERTVQPYQSITGDTELSGVLGEITADVIGQVHSDEEINGYTSDNL